MANIEALKQLRRVVQNAPDDLFHMRAVVENASCGTARCAFGWALVDPWFQQNTEILDVGTVDLDEHGNINYCSMSFYGAANLFDVSDTDANNLFGGELNYGTEEHAVSKEEVIWNIDQLLNDKPALPYAATHHPSQEYAMGKEDEDC